VTTDDALLELARTAEHLADLRATAVDLLGKEWSPERSRDLLETDGPSWAVELWPRLRGLGWADLLVDGSVADLCAVAEAVGESTAPIPLVTSAVATWAARHEGEGETVVVPGVFAAKRDAGRIEVTGHREFVPYADVAARLLVHARDDTGTDVVVVLDAESDGVERTTLQPLDMMPSAAVELRAARPHEDAVVATGVEASALADETRLRLTLGWVAELTGVAVAANAAAADYARERVAFGRPIGSFQAVKHRLVDQRAAIEVSRALVGRAGVALDTNAPDRAAMVALAAFWASDILRGVPEGVIQVFGGIGYTWEHVAHVYLRRAAVLVACLGARAAHRDVAAEWLARR
jgi:alkylation response protein AidB-like acyl-CoA dehydrogenase